MQTHKYKNLNNGHGKREKGGNAFSRQTMKERKKMTRRAIYVRKTNTYIHRRGAVT